MIGKYLNGYSNDPLVPPGWSEWQRGGSGHDSEVYDYTLNENGTLVHYGTDPADFKQDVLTRKAVELRQPPGAEARSRSSSGSPTRLPTAAARTRTRNPPFNCSRHARSPRRATPTRSTPSRCRGRRTSTRPTSPTSPPRSATARS